MYKVVKNAEDTLFSNEVEFENSFIGAYSIKTYAHLILLKTNDDKYEWLNTSNNTIVSSAYNTVEDAINTILGLNEFDVFVTKNRYEFYKTILNAI